MANKKQNVAKSTKGLLFSDQGDKSEEVNFKKNFCEKYFDKGTWSLDVLKQVDVLLQGFCASLCKVSHICLFAKCGSLFDDAGRMFFAKSEPIC